MKKSEAFKYAQYAVIENQTLGTEEKLDILQVLITEETMAKFGEERLEKKGSVENESA